MCNKWRRLLVFFIIFSIPLNLCGCWDYVEGNNLKYVAGIAIDKDEDTKEYVVTAEVLFPTKDATKINSNIVKSKGRTIHEAFRSYIGQIGKMFQLSHSKIIIISKQIASEGIVPVIDLINRDVEVRNDMWILVSNMDTASEILIKTQKEDVVSSFNIGDALKSYKLTGKYYGHKIFDFLDELGEEGISSITPAIEVLKCMNANKFCISGVAVLKFDRLVGFLNQENAMFLSILRGGKLQNVIVIPEENDAKVNLEVMRAKKHIEPSVEEGKIKMNIYVEIDAVISEMVDQSVNYASLKNREILKKESEEYIDRRIYALVKKFQNEYKTDTIGFGKILRIKKTKEWKKVRKNWEDEFQNVQVSVKTKVNIKGSALYKKNIKIGD
ncbi:Ger(x)C family spore germination protein [Haloimpatiens sp. FM7315]|uniref:Ger(x)C family spore germination protein n=1 Tax=Haloimpatiens sp. FM7315 TaxID=3298609 RepID=UPI00370CF9FB